MGSLRGLSLVLRATRQRVADADPLDDEHLVLEVDLAFGLGRQPSPARVDPARLQRATQGAGESTGSGGDDIVERRGVIGILAGRRAVVLTDLVVGAEVDGLLLNGQERAADRASVADDPDPGNVARPVLAHADSVRRRRNSSAKFKSFARYHRCISESFCTGDQILGRR